MTHIKFTILQRSWLKFIRLARIQLKLLNNKNIICSQIFHNLSICNCSTNWNRTIISRIIWRTCTCFRLFCLINWLILYCIFVFIYFVDYIYILCLMKNTVTIYQQHNSCITILYIYIYIYI